MTPHARGFLVTLFGVMVLTPDTLLVRLIDTDVWTMAACRGVLSGVAILAGFLIWSGRDGLREMAALGRAGAVVCGLYALNAITFVVALGHTSVANTLVILATMPFIAAVLAYLVLREPIARATWLAIAAGLGGIAIVFWDGLGRGTLWGDFNALVTAVVLAAVFVLIRRRRDLNMVPATGAGSLLSGLVVLPLAAPLSLSAEQMPWVLLMGLVVLPISFALLSLGPRTVPAPEVALLMLLETVLGPLWVWLGVGERPSDAVLVGGSIVVATLVVHSVWRLRRPPEPVLA